jgi:hypothetical protein
MFGYGLILQNPFGKLSIKKNKESREKMEINPVSKNKFINKFD